MLRWRTAWIAQILLFWGALSPSAQARDWKALYAFGDSYSDTGAGYVDGNGPTAVAYLAQGLGIPFTYASDPHSEGKSLNFAVSGARTGKNEGKRVRPARAARSATDALLGRGMENQVMDFVARVKSGSLRFEADKTLFFLAGGLNDRELKTETTITNLEDEIRQLYEVGGRYFMVALMPTKIPAFSEVGGRLNPALPRIAQELRSVLPNGHVTVSHWGLYFDRVLQNPSQYGITNTTDRCAGRALWGEDPTPCAKPDAYFYYHDGHPSTAVHRVVGGLLLREVRAVP